MRFWRRGCAWGGRPFAYAYADPVKTACGDRPGMRHVFMNRGWSHWGGPWAAGFGARSRFFEGGEVRLALLSLLTEGPKHGYQLMKELKERSGGMYRASAGTVYPTLQMLEDEGLIEPDPQSAKRAYRITEAGQEELKRDPDAVKRIWERAEHWEDWSQYSGPEILAYASPLGKLLKSALRAAKWAAGHDEREAKIRDIIRRAASELEELTKN